MAVTMNGGAAPPGGDGDGVHTRVTRLETRLDTILPTLATKSDVSEVKAWVAGTAFVATALVITVESIVINAKTTAPVAAQTSQMPAQPIVVYPPQSTPPQPSPEATKR